MAQPVRPSEKRMRAQSRSPSAHQRLSFASCIDFFNRSLCFVLIVCPSANDTSEQWSKSVSAVLQSHGVDAAKGLSTTQVEKLRKEHGPNELDKEEGTPLWKVSCTLCELCLPFCLVLPVVLCSA